MAVCALTMLDGMEEVTAVGGVLLLVFALILAWLSTHVADRGDHILGTILTVGAHASLIGLGGHDSYSGGPTSTDIPEQQAPPTSQENKPDDSEPASERGEGEGTGEGAEGVWTEPLLDIQSKQAGRLQASDGEDDEIDEEELEEDEKTGLKPIPISTSTICSNTASTPTSISVRLKFLNDTEEVAVVEPHDTVGILKRSVKQSQTSGITISHPLSCSQLHTFQHYNDSCSLSSFFAANVSQAVSTKLNLSTKASCCKIPRRLCYL